MRSIFNYPYCLSLPGLVTVVKTAHHIPSLGPWSLAPEKGGLTLFSKLCSLFSPFGGLPGRMLQGARLCFDYLNQLRTEKWLRREKTMLKNIRRQMNNMLLPEAKDSC